MVRVKSGETVDISNSNNIAMAYLLCLGEDRFLEKLQEMKLSLKLNQALLARLKAKETIPCQAALDKSVVQKA